MALVDTWQWDAPSFLRAWEAGVFGDQRVELVEGEVWPVVIGDWHGVVAANTTAQLHGLHPGWRTVGSTLPSEGSLPDPDVWVRRRGAEPVEAVSSRLSRWAVADVALVVEVADDSLDRDVRIKARLYGRAGYPTYWVVHRAGVEVFNEPGAHGYGRRDHVGVDGRLAVPFQPGATVDVATLLDVD